MNFVDEVEISIKAGHGGKGCVSFRREKYIENGGPNGGNGGTGGSIIIKGDNNINTLLELRNQKIHKAGCGANGQSCNKSGKKGEDLFIRVPVGTVIIDATSQMILEDITDDGKEFVGAKGGIGGRGNTTFKSSTNQSPRFAEGGRKGEERLLRLELKLLADVGIIGYPNAGKSTLISKISSARPKISDYPFTTLTPNLGVVNAGGYRTFVAADIPGLIDGAHEGKGLGYQFLKHIERTSILLHLLDLTTTEHPVSSFEKINKELELFNPELAKRPQVVVGNKIDSTVMTFNPVEIACEVRARGYDYFEISALTGEGTKALVYYLIDKIELSRGIKSKK